jgi:two-component system LytT family response regulator
LSYPLKAGVMQAYFFIRVDKKYIRINYKDLLYVESVGNYVKLFTENGIFLTPLTIKELEKMLPFELFCRVNRGTIIAIDRIVCFDRESVTLKNARFSFSDKYRKALEGKIRIITHTEPVPSRILHIGPEGLRENME